MDPVSIGLAGAGIAASIGGSVGGLIANSNLNRKNRKFQEEMFYKQNLEWEARRQRINAYDSPQAQKQRLIEAGLNPSLLYSDTSAGGASASPSDPSVPSSPHSIPANLNGLGASFLQAQSLVAENALKESQARYYDVLSNNASGIDVELKESEVAFNNATKELLGQQKLTEEEKTNMIRLQANYQDTLNKVLNQDWESGQSLVSFVDPNGQEQHVPARLVPLYMDYCSLVLSSNEARQSNTLYAEALENIRNSFNLLAAQLPQEQVNATIATIQLGMLENNDMKFTIVVNDKKKEVTYKELIAYRFGEEAAEAYDAFYSAIHRESRKTSWDKAMEVTDGILRGGTTAAIAVASRGAVRSTARPVNQPTIYGAPSGSTNNRGMPLLYDNYGNLMQPTGQQFIRY